MIVMMIRVMIVAGSSATRLGIFNPHKCGIIYYETEIPNHVDSPDKTWTVLKWRRFRSSSSGKANI